jgi:glycosyltransferase involved in cell wall biosynthesis
MRVLIDEGLSTLQQLGGIGYQSVNLHLHLSKLIECDITGYGILKRMPRIIRRLSYIGFIHARAFSSKYDVIHYQNYYVPSFSGRSIPVVTIHDLGGVSYPDVYPEWYNAYFRRTIRNALKRARGIIVPSYAVRHEILASFPEMRDLRIHVCHNGIRSVFLSSKPNESLLSGMGIAPRSYFLHVGTLERRKNLSLLISEFSLARARGWISPSTKLVLVGKAGIGFDGIRKLIDQAENVVHLGRLSDEQIVLLYRYCRAFVFPSLYEGFGIPIIEAMSQNVPILISDIPSSQELNKRHNSQCFVANRVRTHSIAEQMRLIGEHWSADNIAIDYGDLSAYAYDHVARTHAETYTKILNNEPMNPDEGERMV